MCKNSINIEDTKRKLGKLFGMAKSCGLSPMWTHYWEEGKNGPEIAATTCILLDEDFEPVSKGTTLRGTDNPAKVAGRYWSLRRAYDMAIGVAFRPEEFMPVPRTTRSLLSGSTVFKDKYVAKAVPKSLVTWRLTEVEESRIEAKKERLRPQANTQTQTQIA